MAYASHQGHRHPVTRSLAELNRLTRGPGDEQAGVVARRQLLATGIAPHEVARLLRRQALVAVHPGVYVDHTGPLLWQQRAWAAVLATWPAALYGRSALAAADGPGSPLRADPTIHVAISRSRSTPAPLQGVGVHHVPRLEDSVAWHLGPPRQRYEQAALDVAQRTDEELEAIAVLAKACGSGRTTAHRMLQTLADRPRARERMWLESVLRDIARGTSSVLEHGFLTRVERPHRLPAAYRQQRARGSVGVVYRDLTYGDGAIVELDGRLFHDSTQQRDRDLERDLDAALEGAATVRLGWGQVYQRPCATAAKIGRFLVNRGITVEPRGCAEGCAVWALHDLLRNPA